MKHLYPALLIYIAVILTLIMLLIAKEFGWMDKIQIPL